MGIFSAKKKFEGRKTAIVTPTRGQISGRAFHHLRSMQIPVGVQPHWGTAIGKEVADAYEGLFADALEQDCDFIFTVEDDMIPRPDSLARLFDALRERPELAAVGALYCTKGTDSYPLIIGDPEEPLDFTPRKAPARPGLVEVNVVPMGVTLFRAAPFLKLPRPWFLTTDHETQDTYVCRQLRAAGHRLAVDTRVRAGHLSLSDGKVY